ncbi:MAG: hypothetical protein LIR46_00585 [Bacteroidota bacterium]|nr:hypothetical protein [Bacteroidota bacterium]
MSCIGGGKLAKQYNGYTPARYRANRKYDAKTYKKIMFALRYDEDAEIIKDIDDAAEHGISKRDWLNSLFYDKK